MITVVGDVMIDTYIHGSSTRASPECANAPVVKEFKTEHFVGGAGNTAVNIKHLGQEVRLVASFNTGSPVCQLLADNKIPFTAVSNANKDVVKTRVYSNGQYLTRIDYDYPVDCKYSDVVKSVFDRPTDLIVLSDYAKGTIRDPQEIIKKANEKGLAVLSDPKQNLMYYRGSYVLKPNLKEFLDWAEITEEELTPEVLIYNAKRLEVAYLIITLGDRGCMLGSSESMFKRFKALPVKANDVTGAGDSFLAGLAVAIEEGKGIQKAVDFAIRVAGVSVTKKGTSYVNRNEI